MILVLFVHVDDGAKHFGAADRERGLAIDTTQVHSWYPFLKLLVCFDSTLISLTMRIGFLGYLFR